MSIFKQLGHRCRWKQHAGFTMVEILSVVAIIGVLVGLLLPAIQASREGARRMSCSSNLSQVGLAVVGYHNAFDQFPVQLSGTDGSPIASQDNDRRRSIFVALLPFLSSVNLADQIRQPQPNVSFGSGAYSNQEMMSGAGFGDQGNSALDETVKLWPAEGPEPFQKDYVPWYSAPPVLRCPSDPGVGEPSMGRCNYAACLGDGVVASSTGPMKDVGGTFVIDPQREQETNIAMRGLFVPRRVTQFADITDGLSQTLLLGEICTGLGDSDVRTEPTVASLMDAPNLLRDQPLLASNRGWIDVDRPRFWKTDAYNSASLGPRDVKRGYRWADGMPLFTGFNTILPPNREITLALKQEDSDGIFPPSSRHQGGVHLCLADGAVRFVTDSINSGNLNRPTVYPGSYPEAQNPAESMSDRNPAMPSPFGVWGALGTRASSELAAGKTKTLD